MTLVFHHIIDALHGPHDKIVMPTGAERRIDEIVTLMMGAEKFDFGTLHLEPSGATNPLDGGPTWNIPRLTDDELGFIADGLVPLPAPCCWYEFTLNDNRSGLLIVQAPQTGNWHVLRMDFNKTKPVVFDATWVYYAEGLPRTYEESTNLIGVNGPKEYIEVLRGRPATVQELRYGSSLPISAYLTLMLNSKTTEVRSEQAPVKLNKHRAAKGKAPLPSHRVVTIVPLAYRTRARGDGTHASPRLHWRRSHLRTLARGTERERRIVIPRFLVGKAELGEVSHEYRYVGTVPATKETTS